MCDCQSEAEKGASAVSGTASNSIDPKWMAEELRWREQQRKEQETSRRISILEITLRSFNGEKSSAEAVVARADTFMRFLENGAS